MSVVVNLLPAVKIGSNRPEEEAAEALKTPMTTPKMGRKPIRDKLDEMDVQERTALVKAKKHANYLVKRTFVVQARFVPSQSSDSTASANQKETTDKST